MTFTEFASGMLFCARQAVAPFVLVGALALGAPAKAQQTPGNVIEGTVTSKSGAEAGGWVIAETTELPTRFIKIVVTDDRGRYVLPELPKANYDVWVRGYGLVDSPKVKAAPGNKLDLKA